MKTILILAANPKDTTQLRLDEEVREIDGVLRRARRRDEFDIKQQWAVRSRDVQAAMLDFSPQIVHFSGHGAGDEGLALEDGTGKVKFVDAEALAGLFKLFAKQVECVILNACYSEVQADAIARHINYVIGMNQPIGDKAAIEFAVGFYNALGAGRSYEDAYEFGCNAIQMAGILEYQTPVLRTSPNLNSSRVKLDLEAEVSSEKAPSRLSNGQRQRLEQERDELQEQYELLSEEIQHLRKQERTDDLSPRERFRVIKQIEEVEAERDKLSEQIENLENKLQ
ncbi:MAG: CHAT domain-containing protein [Coleofasciculus sp. S288]|nr:CHAT domain-containing protein [Coleofasciculus sp. S288]